MSSSRLTHKVAIFRSEVKVFSGSSISSIGALPLRGGCSQSSVAISLSLTATDFASILSLNLIFVLPAGLPPACSNLIYSLSPFCCRGVVASPPLSPRHQTCSVPFWCPPSWSISKRGSTFNLCGSIGNRWSMLRQESCELSRRCSLTTV